MESRNKEERWPLEELVTPDKCALLIVDVQNDFCSTGGYFDRHGFDIARCRAILSPLSRAIESAAKRGIMVVFVQYTQLEGGLSMSEPHLRALYHDPNEPYYCVQDTWGHQVEDSLPLPPGSLRIHKHRASAFHQTSLDLLLRTNQVTTCVVAGLVTEGCVEATARAAVMHDYFTVLLTDSVASFDASLHAAALKLLSATVDCVSTDTVTSLWAAHH